MISYIYLHIKLTDGSPFYVGKGSGKRKLVKRCRSKHWNNIVNKYGYDIILLEDGLTEEQANQLEQYWINRIGRSDLGNGPLVNFTNGGEGSLGRPMTDEARIAISKANKNRVISKKQKEAISKSCKGKNGINHNRSIKITCNNKIYYGISEANRLTGIPISTIHYSLTKNKPLKSGMHFQFIKP